MERVWMLEQELILENGNKLTIDYWLLIEQTCWGESYGIDVTDDAGGSCPIRHLTLKKQEAAALLERMARGAVTAVTAHEIAEDYLAERAESDLDISSF